MDAILNVAQAVVMGSPLLLLPAEQRLMIWDFVFAHLSNEIVPKHWHITGWTRRYRTSRVMRVLLTCRAIYEEAMPIFYRRNVFVFNYSVHLEWYFRAMPRKLAYIGSIYLYYRGATPPEAFKALALCTELRHLSITTYGGRLDCRDWHERHAIKSRAIQELLKLRGLISVEFHRDMEDEADNAIDRIEYEKLCSALQVVKQPKGWIQPPVPKPPRVQKKSSGTRKKGPGKEKPKMLESRSKLKKEGGMKLRSDCC